MHKITVKVVRGGSNNRHKRNRIIGTVITLSQHGIRAFFQHQRHVTDHLCQQEGDDGVSH